MRLESTAFESGDRLPKRFSADGGNISPPFNWTEQPDSAQSFALICLDDDAPGGRFYHWAIYNIPADTSFLPENASLSLSNSEDIAQGTNNAGTVGYFGPRPPGREIHRYRFLLYALSRETSIPAGLQDKDILQEIEGSGVIERSELMGIYGSKPS
jgi:Raf kinase inhibitor-like YbhB/YbcL family protein